MITRPEEGKGGYLLWEKNRKGFSLLMWIKKHIFTRKEKLEGKESHGVAVRGELGFVNSEGHGGEKDERIKKPLQKMKKRMGPDRMGAGGGTVSRKFGDERHKKKVIREIYIYQDSHLKNR